MPYKLFTTVNANDSGAPRRNGVAVSSTNVYYSKMFGASGSAGYDLQVAWTGTPTGTIVLQVSDKENPVESTDTDWVASTEITVTSPAGSASGFRVAFMASPGKKRLKYTNASGTGVLTASVIVPRFHKA